MIWPFVAVAIALPDRWTLAVGGDAMFNRVTVASKPLAEIDSTLRSADAAIINLEIPLTTSNTPTPRKTAADRAAKKQFILRGDPGHVATLSRAGIDVVSLANNHGMDYGPKAAEQQRQILDKVGILHTGTGINQSKAEQPVVYRSPRGVEFALVSYLSFMGDSANEICWPATATKPGIAALKFGGSVGEKAKVRIRAIVQRAESRSRFVIVALHWGLERHTIPTPYQVALARAFVDAGADLILGHHPHVLQGAELYRGKPIFYSLGNFVSSMPAVSAVFTLRYNDSQFELAKMTPIRMAGRIRRLETKEAKSELARFRKLCESLRTRFPHDQAVPPKVVL